MNERYLLQEIARHTYTAARKYDRDGNLLLEYLADPAFSDAPVRDAILRDALTRAEANVLPLCLSISDPPRLYYAWIRTNNCCYLLGPTRFAEPLTPRFPVTLPPELSLEALSDAVPLYTLPLFTGDALFLSNLYRSGEEDEPFFDERDFLDGNFSEALPDGDTFATLYNTIFEKIETDCRQSGFGTTCSKPFFFILGCIFQ